MGSSSVWRKPAWLSADTSTWATSGNFYDQLFEMNLSQFNFYRYDFEFLPLKSNRRRWMHQTGIQANIINLIFPVLLLVLFTLPPVELVMECMCKEWPSQLSLFSLLSFFQPAKQLIVLTAIVGRTQDATTLLTSLPLLVTCQKWFNVKDAVWSLFEIEGAVSFPIIWKIFFVYITFLIIKNK